VEQSSEYKKKLLQFAEEKEQRGDGPAVTWEPICGMNSGTFPIPAEHMGSNYHHCSAN